MVLLGASVCLSGVVLNQMFQHWDENPVVITIDTTTMPIQLVPFPTITVCSPIIDPTAIFQR